jgi:FtsP/CotA-like multicopper oxidase with cupredoxin domain
LKSNQKILITILVAAVALAAVTSTAYLLTGRGTGRDTTATLPNGCTKPADGFLIIASVSGFNGSTAHGAPSTSWPIIQVQKGQTVTIMGCNTDRQAHGFQIGHYFDSQIETVEPGGVLRVSFVADHTGSFLIYCSIFCNVHIYMQSGQLVVT